MEGTGSRVVRGPDWKWGKQDSGDGHVGTLRSFESHREVLVIWDNGMAANYRCASQFDLRIFDNSAAGIKHEGFTCDGCHSSPIFGIHWECAECPNISLCSLCYHGDKHSIRHQFTRTTAPTCRKVSVPARKRSKKLSARGIFPGASVVRGVDWQWEDQDGGQGRKGKVTEIQEWVSGVPRSAAFVVWDNAAKNLYRVGYEGMCDLKVVTDAKGGMFYRDHLPLVGEDTPVTAGYFEVGDEVIVEQEVDVVMSLQQGFGGWAEGMREVLGIVGTVTAVDDHGGVVVQYSPTTRWTFNPIALKKATPSSPSLNPPSPNPLSLQLPGEAAAMFEGFLPGDFVRVANQERFVREQQQGHGDWVQSMKEILGHVGRVKQVCPTGDLQVDVHGTVWLLNPAILSRVDTDGVPLTPGTSQHLSMMMRQVFETHQPSIPIEELLKAAATGDVQTVDELLCRGECLVDEQYSGQCAAHVAAQNGHIDVLRCLMKHNANMEDEDNDGDLPIHHASFGDEPGVIEMLAMHNIDLNARNRRLQTPLHVAVGKGHISVIRVLLRHHCHPSLQDSDGDTPLHDAISRRRDDLVTLLIEGDADPSISNNNGFNCLHHAALKPLKHTRQASGVSLLHCLRFLSPAEALDLAEASPVLLMSDEAWDVILGESLSSILVASKNIVFIKERQDDPETPGNLSGVKLLLSSSSVLVNGSKEDGFTALHLAALNNHLEVTQHLIQCGADPDSQNCNAQTALHLAVERQHLQVARLLVEEGANVNLADRYGDSPLHGALRHYTMTTIKQLHATNQNVAKVMTSAQKKGPASMSLYLVSSGADLTITNTSNQTPLQLCSDPSLIKLLERTQQEHKRKQSSDSQDDPANHIVLPSYDVCLICHTHPRCTLNIPCGHVTNCQQCSVTTCPLCESTVDSVTKIEECVVCSEREADVLFRPCMHMIACESCSVVMKKCVTCRVVIDQFIPQIVCRGGKPPRRRRSSGKLSASLSRDEVTAQLQDLKEKTLCPVCMERRRNCVFLCGHGACQLCADKMIECPICRKIIAKKIILYD